MSTVAAQGGEVLVDEIYQGLNYDDAPLSATSLSNDAFVVNSFSKYFGMTGWRLGWLVAPEHAVEPLTRLAQNVFLAASTPSQHAALAAFTPECRDILETRRATLKQRRQVLLDGLAELGLVPDLPPQGAFYLWLDISRYSRDSQVFANGYWVRKTWRLPLASILPYRAASTMCVSPSPTTLNGWKKPWFASPAS